MEYLSVIWLENINKIISFVYVILVLIEITKKEKYLEFTDEPQNICAYTRGLEKLIKN